MRIFRFILEVFYKSEIYKYKNLSYMEISIGLVEDDDIDEV